MTIVNGGYAKITKRVYEIEFRNAAGCSWGDYVHAATRREAMSWAGRAKRNAGGKIVHVTCESEMNPNQLEQALDWLHQRGGYQPSPNAVYATRNECFGPF